MLEKVYGLKANVVRNYTEDSLKRALVDGKVIIYFASGRDLGNPNFRAPGPLYHVIVIKGYDGSNFITNDPGTRNGMGYEYSYKTLAAAGADWDHSIDSVDTSKKVIIEVSK